MTQGKVQLGRISKSFETSNGHYKLLGCVEFILNPDENGLSHYVGIALRNRQKWVKYDDMMASERDMKETEEVCAALILYGKSM